MIALVSGSFKRHVIVLMIVLMGLLGMAPRVEAGFVTSLETSPGGTDDMAVLQNVLEDKMVRQRLLDLGLTPDEIQDRLARLSNEDRHALAAQIDSLMPAGSELGTVLIVVLVILVFLGILSLLGKRVVVSG